MQTLYSLEHMGGNVPTGDADKILQQKLEQSRSLLIHLIGNIIAVCQYAETDAFNKSSKHLPKAEDLNVNTKIAGNEVMWKILENETYIQACDHFHTNSRIDKDLIKSIYNALVITEAYKEYIETNARDKKHERKILEFIFNDLMLPNDNFIQHIEELYINWDDDGEMMQSIVLNYLNKFRNFDSANFLSEEKKTFAFDLLHTVTDKNEFTLELIKPKLKNWDADRIASLDLIILQMGVCEFLYFETIPTRVTINEYIDLAKSYSTEQSGQFVNGLLDNIHKELMTQNKITKKVYKDSTL